jgi:hypothetical protein
MIRLRASVHKARFGATGFRLRASVPKARFGATGFRLRASVPKARFGATGFVLRAVMTALVAMIAGSSTVLACPMCFGAEETSMIDGTLAYRAHSSPSFSISGNAQSASPRPTSKANGRSSREYLGHHD